MRLVAIYQRIRGAKKRFQVEGIVRNNLRVGNSGRLNLISKERKKSLQSPSLVKEMLS